jgi:hypothetical protein
VPDVLTTLGWMLIGAFAAFGAVSLVAIVTVGWLWRDRRRWRPLLSSLARHARVRRLAVPLIRRSIIRSWPVVDVIPTAWTDRSLSFMIERSGASLDRHRRW